MAPPPAKPDDLGAVDLVLCTHHHTDHMDGETLRALASRLPDLRFVVPSAALPIALERTGAREDCIIPVDAGDRLYPLPGLSIDVLRAAHETLERDPVGHHRFLGYGLSLGGLQIFHSGDTIPFEGQVEEIAAFAPDVALLPVNGRSVRLAEAGFAGNLSLQEAVSLCLACKVPVMIAHHYGLFAFNTADPVEIDRVCETASFEMLRARFHVAFRWSVD